MKNTVLLIALSTAVSLNAATPVETIAIQAQERVAKIEKMKGLWWAAADKKLDQFNRDLLAEANAFNAKVQYSRYFQNGNIALPAGLNESQGWIAYNDLHSLRVRVRSTYNAVVDLATTQKTTNKEFRDLCIEVANGFVNLDGIAETMMAALDAKFKFTAAQK